MFGARQVEDTPDVTFALFREGLVDVISTDYIGGYHDPILLVLQKVIEEKLISLPEAITLATSNPVKIFPRLAYNKGMIKSGMVADLCIVDREDISRVRYVIIKGKVVVKEGRIDWSLPSQSLLL
jgi:alpha-D-ribose 1-methylphosphonate 5-triphosphate diphosphatase PhnM